MSETTTSSTRRRALRRGFATAAVTATVVAAVATPASAAAATLTLSSAYGPGSINPALPGTPVTITASHATTAWLSGVSTPLKAGLVAATTCPASGDKIIDTPATIVYPATTSTIVATNVTATKVSSYKALIGIPGTLPLAASAAAQKYLLCIYGGTAATDLTLGTASYSVAAPATVTKVEPASGMTVGGNQITVTGTNFPTTSTAITATLGGVALTGVTAINATSFKATVPPGKPGLAALAVTTSAGTVTTLNAYTYSNGINISPNTASSAVVAPATTATVYVDVMGSGFTNLSFDPAAGIGASGSTALAATRGDSYVFLVDGVYTPGTGAAAYDIGPVAICGSVAVISDRELICGMDLAFGLDPDTGLTASAAVPDGTYTLTVINDASFNPAVPADITQTALTSGSTFTVAPY
ncbi:hypothetical protein GCM10010112_18570 [Actinoplanes lobatus]|uniref:IPT/TIG domain-containing protein n=1 Tax=Actinoplanes lobatus TaxID=113568 RepID=A0A7W7H8Z0_9ACTN|nr:IPT/TIG domain-containing protein [Actinoplanes lobatus]MBB4746184.1 hypothetical protein [Actinoplanes lobatus]GGN61420.1 hypothetical protein GCM10010112_18570 [Actinoplanes lobatus]GIE41392.1 hypothetical protein Alo02nite_42900 [Actinoplanes lobatus]